MSIVSSIDLILAICGALSTCRSVYVVASGYYEHYISLPGHKDNKAEHHHRSHGEFHYLDVDQKWQPVNKKTSRIRENLTRSPASLCLSLKDSNENELP